MLKPDSIQYEACGPEKNLQKFEDYVKKIAKNKVEFAKSIKFKSEEIKASRIIPTQKDYHETFSSGSGNEESEDERKENEIILKRFKQAMVDLVQPQNVSDSISEEQEKVVFNNVMTPEQKYENELKKARDKSETEMKILREKYDNMVEIRRVKDKKFKEKMWEMLKNGKETTKDVILSLLEDFDKIIN